MLQEPSEEPLKKTAGWSDEWEQELDFGRRELAVGQQAHGKQAEEIRGECQGDKCSATPLLYQLVEFLAEHTLSIPRLHMFHCQRSQIDDRLGEKCFRRLFVHV